MISWSSDDQNQDNLSEIAEWWTELKGQTVKQFQVLGTATDAKGKIEDHGGLTSTFVIQSPKLLNTNLSYQNSDGAHEYQVNFLHLNAQTRCLRITTISDEAYTFTAQ